MDTDAKAKSEPETKTKLEPERKAELLPASTADGSGAKSSSGAARKGAPAPGASTLTLAAHPRAARRIAQAKGWGGLAGFLLGGYLSLPTHTPLDAAFRALLAGVICYVAVWGAAVFVWRRLLPAELRQAEHELLTTLSSRLQASDPATEPGAQRGGRPLAS